MDTNKSFGKMFFPLALIVVGVVFLLQNLGLLAGDVWSTVFSLWPLFIILLGLSDLFRNKTIVGPTFLIGLGSVFLLGNFHLVDWDAWMAMLNLWPIIIIAIGLEIFIGGKNIWFSIIGVGFTLTLLAVGLWYTGGIIGKVPVTASIAGSSVVDEKIEHPLENDAKSAEVVINSSIGALTIDSLSNSKNFMEGEIYSVEEETIKQDYKLSDGEVFYFISSDWEPNSPNSFLDFDKKRLSWTLFFTDEIPLNLDVSLSVGESNLDLKDLQISELSLDIGVGQTTLNLPNGQYQAQINGGIGQTILHLPDEGQIELDIDGGIGEVLIYIPKDMPAKIYVDRGIAELKIPTGYNKDEDIYTSPDFSEKKDHIVLYISQGIGNIAIREE